jgi:molybdate transport system substrate-binding protein
VRGESRCGLRLVFSVAVAVALSTGGCGDDGGRPRLVVSAASSLTQALSDCADDFQGADLKLSFAGSDELAAQIRQGVKPDVFAAANTKLPDALYAEGLLQEPAVFATNELVLAVPAGAKTVETLADAGQSGVKLAIGSRTVPVGAYTRELLSRLPAATREAILRNVRTEEPDVKGVVGKLTQKAVDGGFVYRSDVDAAKGALRAVALPQRLKPSIAYGAGVVQGAKQAAQARSYVQGLVSGACAGSLEKAGFGPPPSS